MKELSMLLPSSMGVILATTSTEVSGSWRHDADKWGIAFVVCMILWFAARWLAKREDAAQRTREEREEREIKARESRELSAHQERAALMERNNELSEKILQQQIDHGRRMEKLVESGNAAQSNTAQAITSWTRKMRRPCILSEVEE